MVPANSEALGQAPARFCPIYTSTGQAALSRDDAGSASVAIAIVGRTDLMGWNEHPPPDADGLPHCSTE